MTNERMNKVLAELYQEYSKKVTSMRFTLN